MRCSGPSGHDDKTVLVCRRCLGQRGVTSVLPVGRLLQDPTRPCYACGGPAGTIDESDIVWRSWLGPGELPGDSAPPRQPQQAATPLRIGIQSKGVRVVAGSLLRDTLRSRQAP